MPAKGGRGAISVRRLAAGEVCHAEKPLLCVATDAAQACLLCHFCLAPLDPVDDHIGAVTPSLVRQGTAAPAALLDGAAAQLCSAVEGCGCRICGARICRAEECQQEKRRAAAGSGEGCGASGCCPALVAWREKWPRMAASPRCRLFLLALSRAIRPGPEVFVAAVIDTLCQPSLPEDNEQQTAHARMELELVEPLATLHSIMLSVWVSQLQSASDRSPAQLLDAWCTPKGYRSFERRIATNAHGLRLRSPVGAALASAIAAAPTLDSAGQHDVAVAVAAVDGELPFYSATAVFAVASALNHSW